MFLWILHFMQFYQFMFPVLGFRCESWISFPQQWGLPILLKLKQILIGFFCLLLSYGLYFMQQVAQHRHSTRHDGRLEFPGLDVLVFHKATCVRIYYSAQLVWSSQYWHAIYTAASVIFTLCLSWPYSVSSECNPLVRRVLVCRVTHYSKYMTQHIMDTG